MYLYENCKYIESREYISKSDKHVRAVSRGIRLVLRNINTILATRIEKLLYFQGNDFKNRSCSASAV